MKQVARFISVFTHPIFLPIYTLIFLRNQAIFQFDSVFLLQVALITLLFPAVLSFFYLKFQKESDFFVIQRENRQFLFIFQIISLLILALFLQKSNISNQLVYFFAIFNFGLLIINSRWKISLHTAGNFLVLTFLFSIFYLQSKLLNFFLFDLIICISVIYVRKKLKSHSNIQIITGAVYGVLFGWVYWIFFQ